MSHSWNMRRLALLLVPVLAYACSDTSAPDRSAVVASVAILTELPAVRVGDTLTLAAVALNDAGDPIAGSVPAWSSSNAGVLEITAAGRARAVAAGTATVRATVGTKFDAATVQVLPVAIASIELLTPAPSFVVGDTLTFAARPLDADGEPIAGRTLTWSSSDAGVITIDAAGRATAIAPGSAMIRVAAEDIFHEVEVSVRLASVAEIIVAPTPIVVAIGETRQLTATVRDSAGNVLTDREVTWASDAAQTVMVSSTGMVYGVSSGYATILVSSGGVTVGIGTTVTSADPDAMVSDLIYHRGSPGVVGEIMIVSTEGTTAPFRLNAGDVSRHPAPSPDGTRIAFYVSQEDPATGEQMDDIYAVDRNGMNMKRLTSEPGYDGEPAWSPDGTRIVYRRVVLSTGRSSLWIMNADGTGKENLTPDMESTHSLGEPAWSADGSRILFSATTIVTPTSSGIWSMAANGSDKRQHTSTSSGYDQGPSPSPDGERIVFTRRYDDNERDLVILTLATGAMQRIPLQWAQWSPAWSPDGRHIAFYQDAGYTGSSAIYTVRADGTHLELHTPVQEFVRAYDPQWIRR